MMTDTEVTGLRRRHKKIRWKSAMKDI